jgi:hypothetical protein
MITLCLGGLFQGCLFRSFTMFSVSRFMNTNTQTPLTNDELMKLTPSVFANGKHDSRGDRYKFIPTIQIVDAFPDLKVKIVEAFPDDCGEWQIVVAFPDFKVQIVDAFPDIKIKYVEAFPGLQ